MARAPSRICSSRPILAVRRPGCPMSGHDQRCRGPYPIYSSPASILRPPRWPPRRSARAPRRCVRIPGRGATTRVGETKGREKRQIIKGDKHGEIGKMSATSGIPMVEGAGLGLRRAFMDEALALPQGAVDFWEIAPENWIGVGGAHGRKLRALTEKTPFVCHGL